MTCLVLELDFHTCMFGCEYALECIDYGHGIMILCAIIMILILVICGESIPKLSTFMYMVVIGVALVYVKI